MTGNVPQVGIACNKEVHELFLAEIDLVRLREFADFQWKEFDEETSWDNAPETSSQVKSEFIQFTKGLDALVVCHGSPRVDESVFAASQRLSLVGELEGDRFAQRIDIEAASIRKIRTVDTTHGSSYPVAEWALGMILIGLRNAGVHFRQLIAGEVWGTPDHRESLPEFAHNEELTGKTVGLIGAGYIARRLIEFLKPFDVDLFVHDPYVQSELASSLGFTLTSLDVVLSQPDVVVCLAPLTPRTLGMLGRKEIDRIKPGSVFVNVSRGAIVDSLALIERLERGDITACLDVFDPEPVPTDSRIRELPNVFLSPHIAGTSPRSRTRFFEEMVSELERHFSGHETLHNLTANTLANRRGE
jgi:phosphoglycerate dehydrogenase-like enzyme|tara:strand:+ start:1619 stop:2695 length:1077 start_codon:yes stop_codon:yes gene_type:complete